MSSIQFGKFELDSARNIRETEDEIVVPAILDRESILQYENIRSYRSASELQAAAFTLEGAWVVAYRHTPTPYIVHRSDIRGRVKNVSWNAETNSLVGELVFAKSLCDAVLLEKLRKGSLNKDTSTAYFCNELFVAGEFAGQKFDSKQENLMYHHVAVGVPEGRCPSPYCGIMDSFSDFLRVNVQPQQLFSRLTTVLVSAKEGIYALVGKLRQGSKETVTSELMFDAEKGWTQEKAEAWIKEHKDSALPAEGGGQPKTDRERFMAHFGVTAEAFQKFYDLLGDELFKLLPDRGQKIQQVDVETEGLDPFEVLAQSRRLLSSR